MIMYLVQIHLLLCQKFEEMLQRLTVHDSVEGGILQVIASWMIRVQGGHA